MTKEEFIINLSDLEFCVKPLDVGLARMQFNLIKRMDAEKPVDGVTFVPLVEKTTFESPRHMFGDYSVGIYKNEETPTESLYDVKITIISKPGDMSINETLYTGTWECVLQFLNRKVLTKEKWDIFSLCKAYAMWFDYCVKNR